ncbi:hypothetical protein ATANTOWER_007959 [Ataeniobius toweri]|uniref:Secreted protein n=1 Tax=Ataeniobius toweri TaxID=208326 RepID=A0ABU7BAX6_9TELE|nr:hypothetical protein [Ataeniobius toweri]
MQGLLRCIIMNHPVADFFPSVLFCSCFSGLLLFVNFCHRYSQQQVCHRSPALKRLFLLLVHLHSLKLFCEHMLYVCGPEGPNEAKTTSGFAFNQNIRLQAVAQEGRAVSRVACALCC